MLRGGAWQPWPGAFAEACLQLPLGFAIAHICVIRCRQRGPGTRAWAGAFPLLLWAPTRWERRSDAVLSAHRARRPHPRSRSGLQPGARQGPAAAAACRRPGRVPSVVGSNGLGGGGEVKIAVCCLREALAHQAACSGSKHAKARMCGFGDDARLVPGHVEGGFALPAGTLRHSHQQRHVLRCCIARRCGVRTLRRTAHTPLVTWAIWYTSTSC